MFLLRMFKVVNFIHSIKDFDPIQIDSIGGSIPQQHCLLSILLGKI